MNINNIKQFVVITSVVLVVGCSTPARVHLPDSNILNEKHEAVYSLDDLSERKIIVQSGDTLRIVRDAQEPAENDDMTLFVVRPDGYISMPFVGSLRVSGLTPEKIAELIMDKYQDIYRQPQVTVNIAIAPSNRVYVGGAVPNPNFFDLVGATTLEQALLSTGGVLPSADSNNIALLRMGENGKYDLYFFSYANLLKDSDRRIVMLQRGDMIYVPQSGIGSTVEAVDMYFTRLFPVQKGFGIGFNYELNKERVR
ncbi:MAG TPA: polysaccharide export protein [Gammaproteobacteria bacterium]|nr:polysaccharide export protein [Gammaproteobacteria bacterium]